MRGKLVSIPWLTLFSCCSCILAGMPWKATAQPMPGEVREQQAPAGKGGETSEGALPCTEASDSRSCILRGSIVIERDSRLVTDTLVLAEGLNLQVKHGSMLQLVAKKVIIEGAARIDGSGDPGVDGEDAGTHPASEWISHGDLDYWDAVQSCERNPSHPDRGMRGGDGGSGGPGATIKLSFQPPRNLDIRFAGGQGGRPGKGGAGRRYINGRDSSCEGCKHLCPSGPDGLAGKQGSPGKIVILPGEEEPREHEKVGGVVPAEIIPAP